MKTFKEPKGRYKKLCGPIEYDKIDSEKIRELYELLNQMNPFNENNSSY